MIVIVLVVVSILAPVIGLFMIARILRKDEAIDAATFLALCELQEIRPQNQVTTASVA